MLTNTIPYGKCFVRYLRTRCFCIRNLTRSLRSLFRFLIRQQLVRKLKYRTHTLSTEVRFYTILTRKWRRNFFPDSRQNWSFSFFFIVLTFCVIRSTFVKMKWSACHKRGTKEKSKSPTGFEPTTSQTSGRPSIPLSYRELNWRVIYHFSFFQEEHLFREYHIVWYIFLYRNKNFVEIRIVFVRNTYTFHLVFTAFHLFLHEVK